MRVVQPEKFDDLRGELEKTLHEQLEKMGSLAEKVQKEAEKELLEAQSRIDAVYEKRAEEERQKLEEEAKRKLEDEKVAKLKKDVETLSLDADEKLSYATAAHERLEEALKDSENHAQILKASTALGELAEVLEKAVTSLAKALTAKYDEEGLSPEALRRLKQELRPLQGKLGEYKGTLARLNKAANEVKGRESRRAAAVELEEKQKARFSKYDKAKNGFLTKADLTKFAKEEFSFQPEASILDKIISKLADGKKGVPYEGFRRARQLIAIERSVIKERERVAEQARVQAALEAAKEKLKALFNEADAALAEADTAAGAAEESTRPLLHKSAAKLSSAELREHATKSSDEVGACTAALDKSKTLAATAEKAMEGMEAAGAEPMKDEFAKFKKQLSEDFGARWKNIKARVDRCSMTAKSSLAKVMRKEFSETEALRFKLAVAVGSWAMEKSVGTNELHAKAADGGKLTSEKFVKLAKEAMEEAGETFNDEASTVCEQLFKRTVGDADAMSSEQFDEALAFAYTAVKSTMFTEGEKVDSKSLRRLDDGETIRGAGLPRKSKDTGLTRVLCRAIKDDVEGWVTVEGNKGTAFLEPCKKYMVSLKETVITKDLEVASETVRKLAKDELLEVLEFPTKEPTCSVMRIKAKIFTDGVEGWISVANSNGQSFLGPC